MAWVPQRAQLFAATVSENIRLGAPDATDAQVRRAASLAGASDLIDAMPEVMTRCSASPAGACPGAARRISLARAFLREDARLLILDEPTAHLDVRSAEDVAAAIARLARGRTTLLIVHHPGSRRPCGSGDPDRVWTYRPGRAGAPGRGGRMIAALLSAGRLPRGEGRQLALATALATGAMGASIALLATSGYLISRAAQHPPILDLMVAIVAVRAFGIARACMRYEQAAVLARPGIPPARAVAGAILPAPGPARARMSARALHGDLLARFVSDVDTLSDLYLRTLIPSLVALATIVGAGIAAWVILPAAGPAVFGSLLAAAIVLPCLSAAVAAGSGRRQAGMRAQMTGELIETIDGSADLVLAGRADERVRRLGAIRREARRCWDAGTPSPPRWPPVWAQR